MVDTTTDVGSNDVSNEADFRAVPPSAGQGEGGMASGERSRTDSVAPAVEAAQATATEAKRTPAASNGRERRTAKRNSYHVLFGVAPFDADQPISNVNFTIVQGCDVSRTGVGLFSVAEIEAGEVVIVMGAAGMQPIYVRARVAHSTPARRFGIDGFLVGCQLLERLVQSPIDPNVVGSDAPPTGVN